MKNKSVILFGGLICCALLSSCASVAVQDNAIETNTASSLGLEKGTFKISDRQDDGIKTTYTVQTNSGKKYSCYVTGTISVVGRTVSDAVCQEIGRSSAKQTSGDTNTPCNALLKAAGKCN